MRSSSNSPASRPPASASKAARRRASSNSSNWRASRAARILQSLRESDPECLTADGFDDALIGVVEGAGRKTVACYDYDLCIEVLMRKEGMTEDDAYEWMSFNVVSAWVGEYTPVFLHDWRNEI